MFLQASFLCYSGADNGTNRANCDTSTKFGTNVLWGLLVKSARWATRRPCFQDGRHFHYSNFLKNKMHLFGGFQ